MPALVMITLATRGMYARRLRPSILDGIAPILGAVSLATMAVAVAELYVFGEALAISVLVHAWALSAALVGVAGFWSSPCSTRPARAGATGAGPW